MTSEVDPPGSPVAFTGAVLAGGRSVRFGSDKCEHRYRGRTLLQHALAALDGAGERLIVGGPRRELDGARWVADDATERGPLVGIRTALGAASHGWVAVVGCDMPFVPPRLWPVLLARAGHARLVMPTGPDGLEPLAALYHHDLVPFVDEALARGMRSPRTLLDAHGAIVPWRDLQDELPHAPSPFLNANRSEDLP